MNNLFLITKIAVLYIVCITVAFLLYYSVQMVFDHTSQELLRLYYDIASQLLLPAPLVFSIFVLYAILFAVRKLKYFARSTLFEHSLLAFSAVGIVLMSYIYATVNPMVEEPAPEVPPLPSEGIHRNGQSIYETPGPESVNNQAPY